MNPCYRCGKDATTEKGTIYVRRQIDGRWQNVAVCEEHWHDVENLGRPFVRVKP